MKLTPRTLLVVAVIVLGIAVALTAFAQTQRSAARTTWEYKDGANLQLSEINAIGQEGWELATVIPYGRDYYFIFKRPK